MNRITKKYKPGNGDNGYSNLLEGIYLRKDDSACHIQGIIEECRNKIQRVLATHNFTLVELEYVFSYLNSNLFSLASFCYKIGNTSIYQLPDNFLDYLESKIEDYKSVNEDCPDFTKQSNLKLIDVDDIRINIRKLERYYVNWWYSEKVSSYLMVNPHIIPAIQKHLSILNRLSAFIFEAIRLEASIENQNGNVIKISHWQNQTQEFNPPI